MTIIIFIAVLSVLVLVHELGHFLAAKKAGCYVEKFAIGFPPKLWSIKKGETEYAINLLPLGGYVKIKGENGEESDDPRSFVNKSFAWKSLIISAGVLMNFLLGYVLITVVLIIGTPTLLNTTESLPTSAVVSDEHVQIIQILPDTPASSANLQVGDRVSSINSIPIASTQQMSDLFNAVDESEFDLTYEREGELITTSITPVDLPDLEKKGIGVGLAEVGTVSYPWYQAPIIGFQRTVELLGLIITSFVVILRELFTSGSTQADIAGPVGIAVLTGQVAKQGITQLLQFTALLSLNLGIINILPIPALDGGRFSMIILERIRRKRLNVQLENTIHLVGFALLMLLVVLVTANDVVTYGGGILDAIKGLFS